MFGKFFNISVTGVVWRGLWQGARGTDSALCGTNEGWRALSTLAELLLEKELISGDDLIEEVPESIGRYKVIGVLGEGASGRVFLAHDERIGRKVAIKVLQPGVARDPIKFEQQIRLEASVQHEHIAAMYDAGRFDGRPYFVMQFGGSQTLASRQFHLNEAVRILRAVARACAAAHARGIIHRDLKPANILISDESPGVHREHPWAVVADFGLACLLEFNAEETTGGIAGTPAYMAPEQAAGGCVSPQSDIYALGVMLYEQATGVHPFRSCGELESDASQSKPHPLPPRSLRRSLPAEIERITLKAMASEKQDRYRSADEMADDLDRFLAGPQSFYSPPQGAASLWQSAAKSTAFMLLLVTCIALTSFGGARTHHEDANRTEQLAGHSAHRTLMHWALKLETWKRELYQPAAALSMTTLEEVVAATGAISADADLPAHLRGQAMLLSAEARALCGNTTAAMNDLSGAIALSGPPEQLAECHYRRALLKLDAMLPHVVLHRRGRGAMRKAALLDLQESIRLGLSDCWKTRFAGTLINLADGSANAQDSLNAFLELAAVREAPAELALRAAGDLLLLTGHPQEAIGHYHNALRQRSSYVQAYTGLALATHRERDFAGSLQYAIDAIEINPHYRPAYALFNRLTRAALNKEPANIMQSEYIDEASVLKQWICSLERSRQIHPDNPQLHVAIGSVRMLQGCLHSSVSIEEQSRLIGQAIDHFERAIATDEKSITARQLAGIARLIAAKGRESSGEHIRASVNHFSLAIQTDPEAGDAYRWLGHAEFAAGRPRVAITHWQQAVALDPSHRSALAMRIEAMRDNDRAFSDPFSQALQAGS